MRSGSTNWPFIIGLAMLFMVIITSLAGVILPLPEAEQIVLSQRFDSPNASHLFGNDQLGRDIFARVLRGGGVSLGIGLLVTAISLTIGTAIGVLSGYLGGWFDMVFVWIFDTFIAIPGLLLAIAFVAVLGPGTGNIIIALSVMGWVGFARLARGMTLKVKSEDYILAAEASGISLVRLLRVHVLPNLAGPLLVQAAIAVAGVIIVESTLSFLGLSGEMGLPSWGAMLNDGMGYLLVAPHLTIFPGVAIMITVLSLNIISDGLRDLLDARQR